MKRSLTRCADIALQCGHGPKAVENHMLRANDGSQSLEASMRPRPEGRGERRTTSSSKTDPRTASMRPRPEGRGEPCRMVADAGSRPRLASMRPRARRPWRTRIIWQPSIRSTVTLQCGHGPKAVENLHRACMRRSSSTCSFNAATARRPWRTSTVRWHDADVDQHASMRPRPEGRGERETTWRPADGRHGFNAATARRPWRTSALPGG